MSIECMTAVLQARKAPWSHGELMVLLVLANHADPLGNKIFPSVGLVCRSARLKERQVQGCIKSLLADGVLREEKKPAHLSYLKTRLFSLDMARLAFFEGCKICGGAVCDDLGCKKQQPTPQFSTSHIDEPSRTVIEPSVPERAAAPVDGDAGGARALWTSIRAGLSNLRLAANFNGGVPVLKDGRLELLFASETAACKAQDAAVSMAEELRAGAGCDVVVRLAYAPGEHRRLRRAG